MEVVVVSTETILPMESVEFIGCINVEYRMGRAQVLDTCHRCTSRIKAYVTVK